MMAVALIAGCLASDPEPTTTTTQQGLLGPTVDECRVSARAAITSNPNYAARNCSRLKEVSYDPMPCPSCWMFNYTFVCGREIQGAMVSVEGLKVKGYLESTPILTCILDGDCVGDRLIDNVRIACRQGVCEQVPFDDPASMYCLNMSHKVRTFKQSSGATYLMCVFINGNMCEIWSYYFRRCGITSGNVSDCSNYPSGYLCQPEFTPVCAKVLVGDPVNATLIWRPSTNPCMACTSGERNEDVVGYLMGACPPTTTIPSHQSINAAATFCEEQGYAYRLKRYATGREYGVCVFSLDDQCDAEDFFHGRCGPKKKPL
jgi:putative hemolysin